MHEIRFLPQGFICLRDLNAPSVCAVHGDMIGGALAFFLQFELRVAESKATVQHGNISRGVCPVNGYSRSVMVEVGKSYGRTIYLTDQKLTASRAMAAGFVVVAGSCHG